MIRTSQLMVLDDTPPVHPAVRVCTEGGRLSSDGAYYQPSEASINLCWDAPGFVDPDSSVWKLEWQVARWTGLVWDTLTAVDPAECTMVKIASATQRVPPVLLL